MIFAGTDEKKPIMLCRMVKKEVEGKSSKVTLEPEKFGGYIITTMYIGASGIIQLVINLLSFRDHISKYYNQKETLAKKRNRKKKITIIIIILALVLLWLFFTIIIGSIEIPHANIIREIIKASIAVFIGSQLLPFMLRELNTIRKIKNEDEK